MMLRVAFAKVKPEKLQRLQDWLRELMQRQDEVRETFVQETVRHEQAFIVPGEDGPLLVYVIEAEDPELGRRVSQESSLPIDIEHRRIMAEVLAEKLIYTPLYDCCLESGPANRPIQPAHGAGG
jgi:hypothetical protein